MAKRRLEIAKVEKKAIDMFVSGLETYVGTNLLLVKLFGSKARGEATKQSDIDVMVVLEKINRRVEETISGIVQQILLDTGIEISYITFSQIEYNQLIAKHTLFIQNVQKDGIDLWKAA